MPSHELSDLKIQRKDSRFLINFPYSPSKSCASASYKLPNQLSRRMAAFGYGTKSDFTKGANNPAPNKYEKKSFVEKGK